MTNDAIPEQCSGLTDQKKNENWYKITQAMST